MKIFFALVFCAFSAVASDEFRIEFYSDVWDDECVFGVESTADLINWQFVKAVPIQQLITATNGMKHIPIDANGDIRFYRMWISNSVSFVYSPDFSNRQLFNGQSIGQQRIRKNQ